MGYVLFFSGAGVEWTALHMAMQGNNLLAMLALIVGGAMMFGALFIVAGPR